MEIKKILIAEDNPGLARVLAFKFKSCGYTPVSCADGQLAWDAFQADQFAAVVSDQEMPNMTGVELCQHVRSVNPDIPLFLVTGRQLELANTDAVASLDLSQIFAKPFSPGNVVKAVEAAIVKCGASA
ncbi:response regulator [Stieleria marina]|uniref:Alkaline phosphatase synthesis transcriptional regulatory protein PhoP n=1 Tax=Stieleria marina TaxID=1930275 RepID=A0A517NY84_9BACT|nr:Alkaline phosphatase synthesis transcriptional regulatory protein PhoP [Planctomycetes bacterium K23_9]